MNGTFIRNGRMNGSLIRLNDQDFSHHLTGERRDPPRPSAFARRPANAISRFELAGRVAVRLT
jgi:hypothetical protein